MTVDDRTLVTVSTTLVALVLLAFWGYALADLARTPERDVRIWTKPAWAVVLVLTNVVGAIAWFAVGRGRDGAA